MQKEVTIINLEVELQMKLNYVESFANKKI